MSSTLRCEMLVFRDRRHFRCGRGDDQAVVPSDDSEGTRPVSRGFQLCLPNRAVAAAVILFRFILHTLRYCSQLLILYDFHFSVLLAWKPVFVIFCFVELSKNGVTKFSGYFVDQWGGTNQFFFSWVYYLSECALLVFV